MNANLLPKFRTDIASTQSVIDYDKPTINSMIEAVYAAIESNQALPDKGSFSDSQFAVITTVIQDYFDSLNAPAPKQVYLAKASKVKIVLHRINKLDLIKVLIAEANGEVKIYFEDESEWDMYSAMVQGMAITAGFTQQEVKQIWDTANSI